MAYIKSKAQNRNMVQVAFPPFVRPSQNLIEFPGVRLHTLSIDDAESKWTVPFKYSLRELSQIAEIRGELEPSSSYFSSKAKWIFLEPTADWSSSQLALGAFELGTNVWVLRRRLFSRRKQYRLGEENPPMDAPVSLSRHQIRFVDNILTLAEKSRRFRVAIRRWASSIDRSDQLDSIVDCCSAIEAVTGVGQELRLKAALSASFLVKARKRPMFRSMYEMYKYRSEFVHGSKLPNIELEEIDLMISLSGTLLRDVAIDGALPTQKWFEQQLMKRFG